ncbi:hypothetical protein LP417_25065 [Polaromonas sp. P1-6]|nr:hypothetical protein LP417_25065 [Polaromonas sp. P1-6]
MTIWLLPRVHLFDVTVRGKKRTLLAGPLGITEIPTAKRQADQPRAIAPAHEAPLTMPYGLVILVGLGWLVWKS